MPLLKNTAIFLFSLFVLSACSGEGEKTEKQSYPPSIPQGLSREAEQKFKQYWVPGRVLYIKHCAGCHQTDGSGLAQLIPPLADADFLKQKEKVICIIRHGQQGPVVVNGVEYNGNMPANPTLQPLDVAEIATYILNTWGNEGGFVGVQEASAVLKNCKRDQ